MSSTVSKIEVEINGLKAKRYTFEYHLDALFFTQFPEKSYLGKSGLVKLSVNKTERLITILVEGTILADLVCDRSLESFEHTVELNREIFIRDAEADELEEIDVDLYQMSFGVEKLNLSNVVHELIEVHLPARRIHPDLAEEDFHYSTDATQEKEEEPPETDFQKNLAKLKDKFK